MHEAKKQVDTEARLLSSTWSSDIKDVALDEIIVPSQDEGNSRPYMSLPDLVYQNQQSSNFSYLFLHYGFPS